MEQQEKATAKNLPVRFSESAISNIDEITGYIAFIKQAPLAAIKVGDGIFATIEKINFNPWKYKECEQLRTKNHIYRITPYKSWHIIYKIKRTEILILGIIHSSRKPSKLSTLRKIK